MNNTKFFELMGDINDKYFAENYEEPLRSERVETKSTQKRGTKRWIISVSIAAAACLAVGIAAPRVADMIKGKNAFENPSTSGISGAGDSNSVPVKVLSDWLALPHHAINSADKSVMFSPDLIENGQAVLMLEGYDASDIYAVDDCTVTYVGYANTPYLGKVVLVQFNNGLWGMYRGSYTYDDCFATEIFVKDGDKLKAGDRIGTMYPDNFKLLISAKEPSSELFTPKYPELAEWEKQDHTTPIPFHKDLSMGGEEPETLTENLGFRGWHKRFWFMDGSEPVYAVSDGTVYAINDHAYDKDIPAKFVVIKLNTGFDTPLYAIYNCISTDSLTLKVGEDVKEGDVIGNTSLVPMTAPSGITLTISTTPYVPETDGDGNIVIPPETVSLSDWLAQPHNAIDSEESGVTLTPTETTDNSAVFNILTKTFTNFYAVDDCIVEYVGWANAPYLGKVAKVKFDNGLWGLYRISYKDNYKIAGFSVKTGDKLKAGDLLGTAEPNGFKLLISEEEPSSGLFDPEYGMLTKYASMWHTEPITTRYETGSIQDNLTKNLGYCGWHSKYYLIDGGESVCAVSNGTIYAVSEIGDYAKSVILKIENYLGADIYKDIYVIYENLAADSMTLKVGDTVKKGDVIGTAYAAPLAVPPGFTVTISATPYIPEMDEDGNVISTFN